ncbi:hypothetical protein CkaCkLH20_00781 [Colletotrichum karsti]|uniref:Uncharacterized protein n=1 Tax=Colletotrichum karsti TaxID=1095194 RepID=A0A9P6IJI1_9PEZI|nr:uncharacterized protein CkaCkLH20_00781 [Colletotrichum karsti]KAF9881635.1 hypothetical protein CkaCkLH20_00781 [Colletotrichum karsti]
MKAETQSTLDVFYLAQITAGIYRSSNQLEGTFPSADEFDTFYAEHQDLLNRDAWRQYYSPTLLTETISARFYRLPDLKELPDSSDPLAQPRRKGTGHFTKLPRWAHTVAGSRRRQPTLPVETIIQIALSTLEQTISRLRTDFPSVQPYSETQARFWLSYMKIDSSVPVTKEALGLNGFGIHVAQGAFDMWAWEAHYSQKTWESVSAQYLEPELDGTRKSEVDWCGWPDGGIGVQAWCRGWEPEVGSEEEVAFLAAAAVEETKGIDLGDLNFTMRSHILWAVMRTVFQSAGEKPVDDLKRRMVEAGNIVEIDEIKAELWIREAVMVMEPYVQRRGGWPAAAEDRSELLRQILVENGQLFFHSILA